MLRYAAAGLARGARSSSLQSRLAMQRACLTTKFSKVRARPFRQGLQQCVRVWNPVGACVHPDRLC